MPAQERVMRQVSRNLIKLRQLPQWWQDQEPLPIPGEPAGQLGVPGAVSLAASPPLNQEVENLQQAFGNWQTRLVALEKQFHLPAVGTLEQRLAQLQQRVRENPEISRVASPPALPPTPGEVTPGLQPYREPEFSAIGDRIVLPGQLLFEPGSSILTTTGQQLLATIQPDLRRYGAVTVLVASHTAGSDRPEQLRQLSFAQALAVRTYLAQQLPQNQFRWLVAGFGASRPLVVNQADSQNRNQRIEIGIVRSMVQ
ncbi:MAG: flagellar motor protein MotB [Nodosilinea sp.]